MFDLFPTTVPDTGDRDDGWAADVEQIKRDLQALEAEISRLRASQVDLIRSADRLQADFADGHRSMAEWVGAVLDASAHTARRLVLISKNPPGEVDQAMRSGEYGIDRADLLCRLRALGADEDMIVDSSRYSLGHLYEMLVDLRRMDRLDEAAGYQDRYMVIQPTLDSTMTRFWGQTAGVDAQVLQQAIQRRQEGLPVLPDQTRGQRNVDALVSICLDSLTGDQDGSNAAGDITVAEVFVDGTQAAASGGSRGARTSSGVKVGPRTLEEILCHGRVRLILLGKDGRPIGVSDRGSAIPPAVRKHVLHRDRYRCQIDGCNSRYRLQPHHVLPRNRNGDHDPDNLVTLCHYHHHVAIHMLGMNLDPASPPHRRRLLPVYNHDPPVS